MNDDEYEMSNILHWDNNDMDLFLKDFGDDFLFSSLFLKQLKLFLVVIQI